MKKICIVAQSLGNGGSERVASILNNYFISNNYKTLFIAAYDSKREYKILDETEYEFIKTSHKNKLFKLIDRNIKIYKKIKKFNPDVVISFITNELILTERKYSTIFSLRNDPERNVNSKIEKKIRDYIYSKASYIIFQTMGAQNYFSQNIINKSCIIYNPVETETLPLWDNLKCNNVFMTACRLNKQKNLSLMINSFCKFHDFNKKYVLEIYGDGPEKKYLQDLIDKNKASKFIFLKGRSDDIHNIMKKSRCFVLTSDYEGVSNSMLEALCIGLPCICTDCPPGGAREFIKDNNGILVPVGDVNALEKAFITINNKVANNEYNARTLDIRKKLDKDYVCTLWENICKNVCEND